MKNNWILIIVILGILFQNPLLGQNTSNTDNSLKFNVTVGLPTLINSGQSTFPVTGSLGIEKPLTEKFSVEGQLKGAFLSFDRQDGIAHDGGYVGFATVNAGARYYWNGSSAKHPVFTNVTVGGGGWFEEEYNADNALVSKNAILLDIGSGTFIAIKNKIIAGLAVDVLVPADEEGGFMLSAKVGYKF